MGYLKPNIATTVAKNIESGDYFSLDSDWDGDVFLLRLRQVISVNRRARKLDVYDRERNKVTLDPMDVVRLAKAPR